MWNHSAGAHWGGHWGNMGGPGGFGGWFMGGGILGLLWKLLLLVIIVYLIVRLVQSLNRGGTEAERRSDRGNRADAMDRTDSLEIIKTRLARGEITLEEYERMRNVLTR